MKTNSDTLYIPTPTAHPRCQNRVRNGAQIEFETELKLSSKQSSNRIRNGTPNQVRIGRPSSRPFSSNFRFLWLPPPWQGRRLTRRPAPQPPPRRRRRLQKLKKKIKNDRRRCGEGRYYYDTPLSAMPALGTTYGTPRDPAPTKVFVRVNTISA